MRVFDLKLLDGFLRVVERGMGIVVHSGGSVVKKIKSTI